MTRHVFISHSSSDAASANALCDALEAAQVRCWIAPRDVPPGKDYMGVLVEAVADSVALVLLFSEQANEFDHVKREVQVASSRKIKIIPIRIADIALNGPLEYAISALHRLKALPPPFLSHVPRLVGEILNVLPVLPQTQPAPMPQSAQAAVPPSLPTAPARNFGRAALADDLAAACLAPAPVRALVLGGPGLGKTTLTRAVAAHPRVVARFGARRWFVELETANEARKLEQAVLAALGLDVALPLAAALAELARAPGVLVLDNLETPWWAEQGPSEAVLARLAGVPGLVLLASLRGAEPPMGVDWRQIRPEPLAEADGRALFRAIAQGIAGDDPHLPPFLAALGGVPLAIELVAQRAASRSRLAELWDDWQALGTKLAARLRDAGGRMDSLATSIELSLRDPRLTADGLRLFALLGASPAGMATEDARAVLGAAAGVAADGLLASGLAFERGGRLDLLPPVRDHAARAHQPQPADRKAWLRHYLTLLREEGGKVRAVGGREAVARLTPEVGNLEAALTAASGGDARALGAASVHGYARFAGTTGLGSLAPLRTLADASAAAGDARDEAACIECLGDIALRRSDLDAATTAYQTALPLYQQIGSVLGEANCVRSLGDIALRRSDHAAATTAYQTALPLYRQIGDVLGEANCVQSLGDIALRRSDHAAATTAYQTALPLYQQIGDVLGEANCVQGLGAIALRRSDHDAATTAYRTALPLYRRIGSVLGEANCVQSLGDIALERSDHAAATTAYQTALPLYQQIGSVLGEANCVRSLGDIARAEGDVAAARERFLAALALYQRIADPYSIGFTHCLLALVSDGAARAEHLAAAQAAWLGIGREDLVAKWLDTMGEG